MESLDREERWTIFGVVAFTVWSDGRLAAAEVSAARAVAEELELPLDGAGARLRAGEGELGQLSLTPLARDLAYASAAWAALADGVEHPAERAVLRTLRYRLGLPDDRAPLLESSAHLSSLDRSGATARARYAELVRAAQGLQEELRVADAPTTRTWNTVWD